MHTSNRRRTLRAPGPHSFDTRSRALRHWLDSLPRGHLGERARQIFHALDEVNQLQLPAARRFEFLERLGRPLQQLLAELQQHAITPPQDEGSRQAARLHDEFLGQLLYGYRLLLDEGHPRLRHLIHHRLRGLVLHRLLRYGGQQLTAQWPGAMSPPARRWHQLHQNFQLAIQERRLMQRAGWFDRPEHESSLADEYKRLLLLALLDEGHLHSEQQRAVHAALDGWLPLVKLLFDPTEGERRGSFFIQLDDDHPPLPLLQLDEHGGPPVTRLFLDTTALELHLGERLNRSPRQGNGEGLCRLTLETLLVNWCRPHEQPLPHPAKAQHGAIGLGAIYRLLQQHEGQPLPDAGALAGKPQPQANSAAERLRELRRTRQLDNPIWEIATARQPQTRSWSEQIAEAQAEPRHLLRTPLDEPGEALLLGEGDESLCLGELIASLGDGQEGWRLEQVRWLHQRPEVRLAGLEPLLDHAAPALFRRRHDNGLGPLSPCLWGRGAEGQALLLLPHGSGAPGALLELDFHGHCSVVRLGRPQLASPGFLLWELAGDEAPCGHVSLREALGGGHAA